MKKTLLMIFAAASLAACSKNQVIESIAPEVISFDNAFVDNATKSNDSFTITSNTLSSFIVYGTTKGDEQGADIVPIFDYVTVEKSSDKWGYNDAFTQYWINSNYYNFAAVVNADKENISLTDGVPSTIKCDVSKQLDLLHAANNFGKYIEGTSVKTVAFTFNHLLSKVFFTFKNTITSNTDNSKYTYRITGIRINDAVKEAEYGISSKVWTPVDNSTYTTEFGNITKGFYGEEKGEATLIGAIGAVDQSTSLESRLMVPHEYNALNITCTIETLLNGSVIDIESYNKTISQTFEAGKVYNFILSKGNPGDKIEFSVTAVTDWDETHDKYETNL